ncbi:MAG: AAA family ATPase [Promethearchaeota archaeon]
MLLSEENEKTKNNIKSGNLGDNKNNKSNKSNKSNNHCDDEVIPVDFIDKFKQKDKVILEKVILINFNSYQNEEIILDKGLTIITGPNGAGKSTIFQAIKYGMGSNERGQRYEKWSKFLRIIKEKGIAEFGSVELDFLTKDGIYKIQRIIEKDKSPYFKIKYPGAKKFKNTTAVKISQIIRSWGYNPDNVFAFVSQGDITNIKDMKAKEVCSFLEKGLGLSNLREQIMNAKAKLRYIEKQIHNLDSIKDNAAYELELLMPKLERLKEKQKLLRQKDRVMLEKKWIERKLLEQEVLKIASLIQEKEELYTKKSKSLEDLKNEVSLIMEKIEKLDKKHNDKIKKESESKNEIQHLNEEVNKWQQDNNNLADELNKVESNIKILEQNIVNFEKELEISKKELDKFSFQYNILLQKKKELNERFNEKWKISNKSRRKIDEYNSLKEDLNSIDFEITKINIAVEGYEQKIQQNMDSIKELNSKLSLHQKWFLTEKYKSKEDIELLINKARRKKQLLESKKNRLYNLIKQDEKELARLKSEVNIKNAPKDENFQSLIEEIRVRRINTIGPLIDYIEYDPKFYAAIKSILNIWTLNSFIVFTKDEMLELQPLIQKYHIKANVYNVYKDKKLEQYPPLTNVNIEGVYGYLVDLIQPIKYEDIIKKILYSICRNAVVVKDSRVVYEFLRDSNHYGKVVTLDGNIFKNYKYAMELRTNPLKKDRFNPVVINNRISELKNQIQNANSSVDKVNEDLERVEKILKLLKRRYDIFDELISAHKRKSIISSNNDKLLNEKMLLVEKKNKLEAQKDDLYAQLDKIQEFIPKDIAEINKFIDEYPNKIKEIDEKLESLNEKIREYSSQNQKIQLSINKGKEDLDKYREQYSKLKNEIKSRKSEIMEKLNEISDFKKLIKKLDSEIEKIEKQKDNLNEKLNNLRQQEQEINKERYKLEIDIQQLEAQKYNKQQELDEIKIKIQDLGDDYKERPIEEVKNELNIIMEKLRKYYDVSEDLLEKQKELNLRIQNTLKRKDQLREEGEKAEKAEAVLESQYFKKFKEYLKFIENNINKRFEKISFNGSAILKLEGDIENLEIKIFVKYWGQVPREISSLSGGEQSIFAISLMLTLQELNPSPLCIFDEAQMFLDPKNAHFISRLLKDTTARGIQMIIISPDPGKVLLKLADKIIGIAKNDKEEVSTALYYPDPSQILKTNG